ncbi:SDR family oxidoreductase [Rhizobium sp. SSA_523]|uniref:SDR family oxidoreductase n=1 Tax=Rhizobium sp. SSA_523 TaxID=2952477 RepID=UPI002090C25F|nr:SDR family oxidoreductase [Rhizobium sp. SSA_523]MCO5731345.1 SDR family oxidoreductase [Rhizobium sp. SSA_523]WKC22125.1 SDR family oxidoreductase [Rhizobium sp. SSA_523]
MTKRLSNKTALITGSSRGIGRAVALAFARDGAAFIGVHYSENAKAAEATVRDIEALGVKAVAVKAELRQGKAAADSIWSQFSEAARRETGTDGLDILVNNAGIAPALPLSQTSEDVFDDVMTINYKAPFFLIQAVANHIRDNGRIINISTGFTRIAAPTHPAYAASKGALETLTLALAPDFAGRGITVNAVLPGVTATDMNAEWLSSPDARAGAEALSVFSRVGQPEDVADVIAFLASNDARWTTGQMIDATGGARI